MEADRSGRSREPGIVPVEEALREHLERAHALGERAQRSNDLAQHEIDCALRIAERLRHQFER